MRRSLVAAIATVFHLIQLIAWGKERLHLPQQATVPRLQGRAGAGAGTPTCECSYMI